MSHQPDDTPRFIDKRRGGFRSRFRPLSEAVLPKLGTVEKPHPSVAPPLPPKPAKGSGEGGPGASEPGR